MSTNRPDKETPQIKVMIIDPNPNHRHQMKDILRGLEMVDSVSDRGSPHSILEILAENPVDVIMIDQNPGGGNVFDIVKVIRSKSVGAHTNFVLMAESLDDAMRQEGSAAGIRGFLGKPYDIRGIETALVAAAGLDRQPEAAVPAGDAAKGGSDRLRDTLDKLRRVSLFSGFSDPELIRLLKICRTRNYPAGSFVFHEGEQGYSLYVLVAGTLEIRKEENGTSRVLVEMHPGDCFGEMAIIADEPRMADAAAATDCTVIEVNASVVNSNEDIISLKLVRQIAILLAKKLRLRG